MTDPADNSLFQANGSQANGSQANGREANGHRRPPKLFVRDLADGQAVRSCFLVRERTLRKKRNGDDFLRLTLADATGQLPAVCWEDAGSLHDLAAVGAVLEVSGRYSHDQRFGPQLTVESLVLATSGDYDLSDLVDAPAMDVEQMEADLRRLVETVRNPHLRRLLDELLGERSDVWRRFRAAPAAKFYHQAYGHGLLEHTLSVAQAVSAVSAAFPGIDRGLAVTGALIHDIGKIEAYGLDPVGIDLTDDGRLLGEIPLGYYLVRRTIERLDGFPWPLARALLHVQLAHHGTNENGSPVVPATREATLVHSIDNLGGKLGSFDRLQKELAEGETWSRFDRALEGAAYFAAYASESGSDNGNGSAPVRLASGE